MKNLKIYHFLIFGLSFFTSGCASKLIVQSEPSQAEVFARVEGKQDKILLGQTPLEISEKEFLAKLALSPDATQWVNLIFEKQEHSPREVVIPSSRWGEQEKILKLKLESNPDKMTIVQKILAHFFNAKEFAESKQFDQAHTELDKVLDIDKSSVRALNMKAGVYYLQGKYSEARSYYRQALNIDPAFSDAIEMMEKLETLSSAR